MPMLFEKGGDEDDPKIKTDLRIDIWIDKKDFHKVLPIVLITHS
ncbi:MAG: hypothetical protein SCALA701_07220 [Candidatus Scalindua sp.]|nr:MAG: hypothetical protein SCALA701_07220 [Candidatus Scalindua sp.]